MEASGRGKHSVCQETRLSAVPRAGKGCPELEASDTIFNHLNAVFAQPQTLANIS